MTSMGLPTSKSAIACRQVLAASKTWEQISAALDQLESGNYLTSYERDKLRGYQGIYDAKRKHAEAGRRIRQALGLPAAAP